MSELSDSGVATVADGKDAISAVAPVEAGPSRETESPYQSRSDARDEAEQTDGPGDEGSAGQLVPEIDESALEVGESRQAHFDHLAVADAVPDQPSDLDQPPAESNSEEKLESGADAVASSEDDDPDRDLVAEAHKRELGHDPATGRFRPAEAETAIRVEETKGVELARSADPRVDWRDANSGETYDAVGNFPAKHFDKQWPNLQTKITDHLDKADYVPVDVSQFTPEQIQKVREFIDDNGLGPRAFLVGQ